MLSDLSPYVIAGTAVAVLVWDVMMAASIVTRAEAPRFVTQLTAFCGLLVVPMVLIGSAAGTTASARTIVGITWLLPVVAVACAIQSWIAVGFRLVPPRLGVPLVLYNIVVVGVTVGDYVVAHTGRAPLPLQTAVAARDTLIGLFVGPAALVSPLTLLVPVIAPAEAARSRLAATLRTGVAVMSVTLTGLLLLSMPRAVRALHSYEVAVSAPSALPPRGDLQIGVRLLPPLVAPPSARQVQDNRAIVTAFRPALVMVVLEPDAARPDVLDSLQRVLTALSVPRTGVVVALRLSAPQLPPSKDPARLRAIERTVRRLHPAVVFPALPDPIPGWFGPPRPSAAWWRLTLEEAAAVVTRVRPATRVGWSATQLDATDSAVYAWAAAPDSPVDVLAAGSYPSFDGLTALETGLRRFDRWHRGAVSTGGATQPHWLVTVGGLPHAHGDRGQLAAMQQALAWGSRRPWISTMIIGEPGDDIGRMGLWAADGRPRTAFEVLSRTVRPR